MFDNIIQNGDFIDKVIQNGLILWEDGGRLPEGYTRVRYLEGDGGQYIDTGIYPDEAMVYEVKYYTENASSTIAVFGGRRSFTSQNYSFWARVGSNRARAICGSGDASLNREVTDANLFGHIVNVVLTQDNVKINDTVYDFPERPSSVLGQSNGKLLLFNSTNSVNVMANALIGRIYKFRVTKGEDVLLNYIPCLDASGKPCMFDTVTQQPFYNSGTGEFLYA